jgi:uncharacterized protein YceH (UPF0502 family)
VSRRIDAAFKSASAAEQNELEYIQTAQRLTEESLATNTLLDAANARIEELEAENAALKERLTKYESPEEPQK